MADEGTNLYEPCKDCKKKRTLCVRVRRPIWRDFGHAALSVHEGDKTTTYGNWPEQSSGANTLQKDYKKGEAKGDDYTKDDRWDPKDVKCKEIDEEQEKKLKEAVNKKQQYDLKDNNCAKWAGSTWNNVTGDSLDYGAGNWVYSSPTTLGDSIAANP